MGAASTAPTFTVTTTLLQTKDQEVMRKVISLMMRKAISLMMRKVISLMRLMSIVLC